MSILFPVFLVQFPIVFPVIQSGVIKSLGISWYIVAFLFPVLLSTFLIKPNFCSLFSFLPIWLACDSVNQNLWYSCLDRKNSHCDNPVFEFVSFQYQDLCTHSKRIAQRSGSLLKDGSYFLYQSRKSWLNKFPIFQNNIQIKVILTILYCTLGGVEESKCFVNDCWCFVKSSLICSLLVWIRHPIICARSLFLGIFFRFRTISRILIVLWSNESKIFLLRIFVVGGVLVGDVVGGVVEVSFIMWLVKNKAYYDYDFTGLLSSSREIKKKPTLAEPAYKLYYLYLMYKKLFYFILLLRLWFLLHCHFLRSDN